ncbi:MAG: pyridoxine 5'-phosphate synthase [Planctomycetota bacterium]
MALLQVNIDHVATVRQARQGAEPDPVQAASLVELAGASGITIHLREDRRHISDRDLELLRQTVRTRLNLEMAATAEMISIAKRTAPEQVTLVPEKRQELTTEGGLDVVGCSSQIRDAVQELREAGRVVSLFIDPSPRQIEASRGVDADGIELHTGRYAEARLPRDRMSELECLARGVVQGRELGLAVHAGHGLNYQNTGAVAALPGVEDLNIGHSIVSRAVLVGLDQAVRDMLVVLAAARTGS